MCVCVCVCVCVCGTHRSCSHSIAPPFTQFDNLIEDSISRQGDEDLYESYISRVKEVRTSTTGEKIISLLKKSKAPWLTL